MPSVSPTAPGQPSSRTRSTTSAGCGPISAKVAALQHEVRRVPVERRPPPALSGARGRQETTASRMAESRHPRCDAHCRLAAGRRSPAPARASRHWGHKHRLNSAASAATADASASWSPHQQAPSSTPHPNVRPHTSQTSSRGMPACSHGERRWSRASERARLEPPPGGDPSARHGCHPPHGASYALRGLDLCLTSARCWPPGETRASA